MSKMFVCGVCGHIEFDNAPEKCPVCAASKDRYQEDENAVMPSEKEGKEKHVPTILVTDACGLIPDDCRDIHVKVGSVPHPMADDHWIMWIDEYVNKTYSARYYMMPQNMEPALGLHLKKGKTGTITIVANCNKHGRWMAEAAM
jgi:superoxide reductase